jgi:hypothetical protein
MFPPSEGDPEAGDADDLKIRARLREALILKTYRKLVDEWPVPLRAQCTLNRQLVRIVSESYFKDMDRKKAFHGITYADVHKCAAYMAKWIMRFRPIQLTVEDARAKPLLANEYLALAMAFVFLKVNVRSLPTELFRTMVYSMRYRLIDGNAWAMSFYLLQQQYGPPQERNGHHN